MAIDWLLNVIDEDEDERRKLCQRTTTGALKIENVRCGNEHLLLRIGFNKSIFYLAEAGL